MSVPHPVGPVTRGIEVHPHGGDPATYIACWSTEAVDTLPGGGYKPRQGYSLADAEGLRADVLRVLGTRYMTARPFTVEQGLTLDTAGTVLWLVIAWAVVPAS